MRFEITKDVLVLSGTLEDTPTVRESLNRLSLNMTDNMYHIHADDLIITPDGLTLWIDFAFGLNSICNRKLHYDVSHLSYVLYYDSRYEPLLNNGHKISDEDLFYDETKDSNGS